MVQLQVSAGVVGGYHYAQRTANSYLALLFDKSRIKEKDGWHYFIDQKEVQRK